MNVPPEILPGDDIAALALMEALLQLAAQPQVVVLERVAQLFALHRSTHTPGPLARALENARTHLLVAGSHNDELLKALNAEIDSARNLSVPTNRGKGRAA